MNEINAVAVRFGNITMVENAAQSCGAQYKSVKSYNLSGTSCTSFFSSKPLGCYRYGRAILTNDNSISRTLKKFGVYGRSVRCVHISAGVGGQNGDTAMHDFMGKFERFDWGIERRDRIDSCYADLLDLSSRAAGRGAWQSI